MRVSSFHFTEKFADICKIDKCIEKTAILKEFTKYYNNSIIESSGIFFSGRVGEKWN